MCLNIEGTISESVFDESITGVTSLLYYIGYSVSVVALLFAMFIFLYFNVKLEFVPELLTPGAWIRNPKWTFFGEEYKKIMSDKEKG
ncbi:hypothetical protein RUM44_009677 [Polyplax serrata]|uniref:Uncharacterized protein n=1 Tax=Polyplax serrata TaxID=468196 RepID=A0ABR1ATD8_POLSC